MRRIAVCLFALAAFGAGADCGGELARDLKLTDCAEPT
jgi:hypothetical protein